MNWTSFLQPIVADVIRWKEPIWAVPNKKRGTPDRLGEQILTAEVKGLDDFLQLYVRAVEVLSLDAVAKVPPGVNVGDKCVPQKIHHRARRLPPAPMEQRKRAGQGFKIGQ